MKKPKIFTKLWSRSTRSGRDPEFASCPLFHMGKEAGRTGHGGSAVESFDHAFDFVKVRTLDSKFLAGRQLRARPERTIISNRITLQKEIQFPQLEPGTHRLPFYGPRRRNRPHIETINIEEKSFAAFGDFFFRRPCATACLQRLFGHSNDFDYL